VVKDQRHPASGPADPHVKESPIGQLKMIHVRHAAIMAQGSPPAAGRRRCPFPASPGGDIDAMLVGNPARILAG
jgi:hypothetical protein